MVMAGEIQTSNLYAAWMRDEKKPARVAGFCLT